MKKLCLIGACAVAALALPLAVPAGGAGNQTRVVCLDEQTFAKEYKVTPRHCIYHRRHRPKAEAFFVRTTHVHWRVWGRDVAKGKGRQLPSMGPPSPVKIRLHHPIRRCGHRVFSEAHFFFPEFNHSSNLRIDTCA